MNLCIYLITLVSVGCLLHNGLPASSINFSMPLTVQILQVDCTSTNC